MAPSPRCCKFQNLHQAPKLPGAPSDKSVNSSCVELATSCLARLIALVIVLVLSSHEGIMSLYCLVDSKHRHTCPMIQDSSFTTYALHLYSMSSVWNPAKIEQTFSPAGSLDVPWRQRDRAPDCNEAKSYSFWSVGTTSNDDSAWILWSTE